MNSLFRKILTKKVLVFLGILFIAIFLRFYLLGQNPTSLDWDEVSMGYNAYSLLLTGADEYGNRLPLEIRSFDDYKPPVYTYLTVPSVAFFGLNSFAVRLPAAVFGVIAVIAVFFLTKELLKDTSHAHFSLIKSYAPYAVMFSLAVSPWHLQFSRAAFEGNIGVCFFSLGLLLFLKGLQKGSFLLMASLFFVLSMYSYHSFRLVVPLFFIIAAILFWKQLWIKKWYVMIGLLILVCTTFPIYRSFIMPTGSQARLSMVTIFGNSEFLQSSIAQLEKSKQHHDRLGEILNNRRFVYTNAIIQGYFSHFDFNFLFLNGDGGRQHHALHVGMLYLWDFVFLLFGIWFMLKHINKRLALCLLLIFIAPLPASITTGTPHPVRAIAMIPFLQIAIGIGFIWFIAFLRKRYVWQKQIIVVAFCIGLFVWNFMYYVRQYYIETPRAFAVFWQYGYKEVFDEIRQRENKYDKIIVTYYYDQPYIYYLFYNKIDPRWYQKHWDINMNGKVDRMYRVIGKYEFRQIDWSKDSGRQKTLIIAGPKEIPNTVKPSKLFNFPDGTMAFEIVSL